jgi:hypothetical protein
MTTVRELIAMLLKCEDMDEQITIRDKGIHNLRVHSWCGLLPHYYSIESET